VDSTITTAARARPPHGREGHGLANWKGLSFAGAGVRRAFATLEEVWGPGASMWPADLAKAAETATAEADAARHAQASAALRQANSALETELAMTRGVQAALTKQVAELTQENQQVREELAFLQKLVADASRQVGVSIPRLDVEKGPDDTWHYRILVVRGGSPREDFEGHLAVVATLAMPADDGSPGRQTTLNLPDDQPDAAGALKLRFKYYQRIEGTLRIPPGARVRSLTVRAYESGASAPRATRTLALS